MAKFGGGFGGGFGGNQQQMMMLKQVKKMQEDMQKAQQEVAETEVVGTAGGGMVEVVMTGNREVVSVTIKPEAVDPDDVEMLEDLIVAAFNDAASEAQALNEELMAPYASLLGGIL